MNLTPNPISEPTVEGDDYIVLLTDPDWNDWSPWNVVAQSIPHAIELARSAWRQMYDYGEDYKAGIDEPPQLTPDAEIDVWKVYRHSWIGERVL